MYSSYTRDERNAQLALECHAVVPPCSRSRLSLDLVQRGHGCKGFRLYGVYAWGRPGRRLGQIELQLVGFIRCTLRQTDDWRRRRRRVFACVCWMYLISQTTGITSCALGSCYAFHTSEVKWNKKARGDTAQTRAESSFLIISSTSSSDAPARPLCHLSLHLL